MEGSKLVDLRERSTPLDFTDHAYFTEDTAAADGHADIDAAERIESGCDATTL